MRFVNLAPGSGTTANTFNGFLGTFGSGHTLVATSIAAGAPAAFRSVMSGSNTFSVLQGHSVVIPSSAITVQGGSVNTPAIVSTTATSGGVQLVNIPRCS